MTIKDSAEESAGQSGNLAMTNRVLGLLLAAVVSVLVGCSASPTATSDLVGTEVAVRKAAISTLTAQAPTATHTPLSLIHI